MAKGFRRMHAQRKCGWSAEPTRQLDTVTLLNLFLVGPDGLDRCA